MSFEELLWHDLRSKRTRALVACDWRAGKDVVLSTAWKEYRQALRDLPEHDSPEDAENNWPVKPDD